MSDQELREALNRLAEPPRVTPGTARSLVAAVDRRRKRRRGWLAGAAAAVLIVGGVAAGSLLQPEKLPDPAPARPTPVPSTDRWIKSAPSPLQIRDAPLVGAVGGKVYVLGGRSRLYCGDRLCRGDQETYGDGALYDPVADAWQPIAPAPDGTAIFDASAAGGVLVANGVGGYGDAETTFVYDPSTGIWDAGDPPPDPAVSLQSATWDGERLHGLPAWDPSATPGWESRVWSFDPATGEWADDVVPELPWSPAKEMAVVGDLVAGDDGTLYLIRSSEESDNRLARWSPGEDSWETLDDLPWRTVTLTFGRGGETLFWHEGRLVQVLEGGLMDIGDSRNGGYAVDPDSGEPTDLLSRQPPQGVCPFPEFGAAGDWLAVQPGVLVTPDGSRSQAGPPCPRAADRPFPIAVWTGSEIVAVGSNGLSDIDLSRVYRWAPPAR